MNETIIVDPNFQYNCIKNVGKFFFLLLASFEWVIQEDATALFDIIYNELTYSYKTAAKRSNSGLKRTIKLITATVLT